MTNPIRAVYLREADVLPVLDEWLATLFDPTRRRATIRLLAESQRENDADQAARRAAEEKIAGCDAKLARYRAALEAGTDPEVVAEWIREVKPDRALANAQLAEQKDYPQRLDEDEVAAHLDAIGDVSTMIRHADREAKSALYNGLDLRLTYHPVERKVRAEANLNSHDMYKRSCPRGDLNPHALNLLGASDGLGTRGRSADYVRKLFRLILAVSRPHLASCALNVHRLGVVTGPAPRSFRGPPDTGLTLISSIMGHRRRLLCWDRSPAKVVPIVRWQVALLSLLLSIAELIPVIAVSRIMFLVIPLTAAQRSRGQRKRISRVLPASRLLLIARWN
ncbi:hypothetical protein [Allosalinactinospora lopnorensis]|uniref:hypothetical protein n=1 Tax=Allosalinactinospora lopnorensis TaxID=1352348 RepID=UPI0012E1F53B|nr:hypothetical protein [Allosalinactinospora lopnorensis]